ncbi:helix-turn-helix domain-containing protein [Paenibacillus alvei]|uniref:Helix-turn-helix domain-containing protein n=1 Tax=Paenibacillus alvei TaxID=44250 RepID=A0ABT4E5Y9_PAEAL|nr:helix-turn-helix transcriptional regulator [Paenibacillus alvei]MCY9529142.1 helix-turn-helix domain-containing protein [Paenibacillus alvei]
MTLGARLKELRRRRGYTQDQMAEKLGMNRANFSNYERGVATPPSDILPTIADILDTTTDYLLGRTNNSMPLGSGSAYYGGGDDWTDEEKAFADAAIEAWRRRRREQ